MNSNERGVSNGGSDAIERLSALFERFPGIGPRQAGRFVQFILRSSPALRRELADSLQALSKNVHQCPSCMRFHSENAPLCSLCAATTRSDELLSVVASDADVSALERSDMYRGRYFVLGGTISLASEKTNGLRIKELLASLAVRAKKGLREVILAFPVNPEGDATATRLREELSSTASSLDIKVTSLGRGLSTGSELEYADTETLKSALEGRR